MKKELPIFSHWTETLGILLDSVGRFPRNVRPTLGQRLLDRGLDVFERVVDLRYSRDRADLFSRANLDLEKVRILVRIAFERRLIGAKCYEDLATRVDACGRMLGGWQRSTAKRAGGGTARPARKESLP